jgi:hypothetical protein
MSLLPLLCLSLSLLLSLSLSVSAQSPVTVNSFVLCNSLTDSVSVQWDSSIRCDVICNDANSFPTVCTNGKDTFFYAVTNHEESMVSASVRSLSSPDFRSNVSGTLADWRVSADKKSISFRYTAPPSGISEEILVDLISQNDNAPIRNSPFFITLLPTESTTAPFFSFRNQVFVVVFVIFLCVFAGIASVSLYSWYERRTKRSVHHSLQSADANEYAALYEEDIRHDITAVY